MLSRRCVPDPPKLGWSEAVADSSRWSLTYTTKLMAEMVGNLGRVSFDLPESQLFIVHSHQLGGRTRVPHSTGMLGSEDSITCLSLRLPQNTHTISCSPPVSAGRAVREERGLPPPPPLSTALQPSSPSPPPPHCSMYTAGPCLQD